MGALIHAAANTLAAALAELSANGYRVNRLPAGYQATRDDITLLGDDVLALLALAVLHERRGTALTAPHDSEIDALLRLESDAEPTVNE